MDSDVCQSLLAHLPLVIYRCSPERRRKILFMSNAATQITGYSLSELLEQHSLSSLVRPADRLQVEPQIQQALQQGERFAVEYRLLRADGSSCYVLEQGKGVYAASGELLYVVGALMDVSNRAQLEAPLLQSESRYRIIGKLSSDDFFSFRVNHDGSVEKEWEAAQTEPPAEKWLKLHTIDQFPRSLEEWLLVVHPEDRSWVQQTLQDIISTNRGQTLEYRLLEQDGMARWVRDRLEPEWDVQEHRVVRLLGATQDITERKQTEVILQEHEQRYRSLVENVPVVLFRDLRNPNWKAGFLSEQVQALCGYTAAEFTYYGARSWTGLVHPEDQPFLFRQIDKALAERLPYTLEYRIIHADGGIRWIQECGQGVFSLEGELLSVDGILVDISARKQAEAKSRLQSERERLIGAIAIRIRQSLKLPEILQATVNEIRGFLNSDRVEIACCNTNGVYQVVAESVQSNWQSLLGLGLQEPWFWERLDFYRQGYYEIVHDLTSEALSGELHAWMERWHIKSRLAVPILSGKQFWGVIAIHQCSENRNWQNQEITLMEQLANQVGIAIQQAELYRRLEIANRQLEQLAFLDSLTQIANRRRFDEHLEREWRRLRREQAPLSLILCDVDYFKRYNDTYGHPKGDDCLQQIARVLEQVSQRPADLAARYGGEEFALILPCTDPAGASQIVESIQERIRNLRIVNVNSYITLSFGVTSMIPSEFASIQTLVASADLALYQAKASGKNRYVVNLAEH
jgi:diguanylate cyclase (GGDEF)-like protein/PAS domain S-box-containing protein